MHYSTTFQRSPVCVPRPALELLMLPQHPGAPFNALQVLGAIVLSTPLPKHET